MSSDTTIIQSGCMYMCVARFLFLIVKKVRNRSRGCRTHSLHFLCDVAVSLVGRTACASLGRLVASMFRSCCCPPASNSDRVQRHVTPTSVESILWWQGCFRRARLPFLEFGEGVSQKSIAVAAVSWFPCKANVPQALLVILSDLWEQAIA